MIEHPEDYEAPRRPSPFGPTLIARGTQSECTECQAVALFGHTLIHGPRCSGWPRAADLAPAGRYPYHPHPARPPGGWSDSGPINP